MTTPRFLLNALGGQGPDVELIDARLGFRAGYVIEIVDERTGETVQNGVVVFALNPNQYTLSEPFAVTLTPTEDDTVVAEENGLIIREITLEGTFGFSEKRIPNFTGSQGDTIGGGARSGNQHFIALRQLFRLYSNLKKNPERSPFIRMIFHSLKDDDHFVVTPRQFETPRDNRSTRVTYMYRITMAVIGDSERRVTLQQDTRGNFLESISSALNDARATFADLTSQLGQIKRKVANFQAVLIQAGAVITAVSNFVRAGAGLINFSYQQAVNVVDTIANAADDLADIIIDPTLGVLGQAYRDTRRLEAAFNRILQFPERFEDAATEYRRLTSTYNGERNVTQDDLSNREAGVTPGTRLRIASGLAIEAGLDLGEYRGFRSVTVARGDSLEGLAARYAVTPELIVLINRLRFPYFAPGGGPGLRGPGDTILVPLSGSSAEQPDQSTPGGRYLTADEALYGRDFALDPVVLAREQRFEFLIDEAHGSVSEATITGVPNVVQGITLLIGQERNSNAYLPNVGIRRTAGQAGTIQGVLLASLNLREAILSDPRIDSIAETQVVLDGDELKQEITPVIRGRRDAATLVVPVGQVSGE